METTAAIRLPGILIKYRKMYPRVQLSLSTGTTSELIKAVECRRLDGAFIGGHHQNEAVIQQDVFKEELVLVSSSEHKSLRELTRQMPQQTVLAFRAGCFYRSTLENWFYQIGLIPNQILELGTLDGILSCVAAGMGVTMLPRSVVERYASRGLLRCHAVPAEFGRITTVFAMHADSVPTAAVRALVDLALHPDAARVAARVETAIA